MFGTDLRTHWLEVHLLYTSLTHSLHVQAVLYNMYVYKCFFFKLLAKNVCCMQCSQSSGYTPETVLTFLQVTIRCFILIVSSSLQYILNNIVSSTLFTAHNITCSLADDCGLKWWSKVNIKMYMGSTSLSL